MLLLLLLLLLLFSIFRLLGRVVCDMKNFFVLVIGLNLGPGGSRVAFFLTQSDKNLISPPNSIT